MAPVQLVGQTLLQRWLKIEKLVSWIRRDVDWGWHTCDGKVSLFVLDDRILHDILELGPKITCERDRVNDAVRA